MYICSRLAREGDVNKELRIRSKKGFEKRLKKVLKRLCRNKKGCMFAAAKNGMRFE